MSSDSSGHYYDKDGVPCHSVPNKSKPGEFRSTTASDAKKLGLLPSVTTIFKLTGVQGGLLSYLNKEYAKAAYEVGYTQRGPRSFDKNWRIIQEEANKHSKAASEEGTRLHKEFEDYIAGLSNRDYSAWVFEAYSLISNHFDSPDWTPEVNFGSQLGYAGQIDLLNTDVPAVVDLKTTTWKKGGKPNVYPTHIQQLVAYADGIGLNDARLANLYVHRETHELVLIEHSKAKIKKARAIFRALLNLWQVAYFDSSFKEK